MNLNDLLPMPEIQERQWWAHEVYRRAFHETGGEGRLMDRVWSMYRTDFDRAGKWFMLFEAVKQNIYEQMVTARIKKRENAQTFADIMKYNVRMHFEKIDQGVVNLCRLERQEREAKQALSTSENLK